MYCLFCHEKIPRLRSWRTKSEFCSDEHALLHRQQTLERLFVDQNAARNQQQQPSSEDAPAEDSEQPAEGAAETQRLAAQRLPEEPPAPPEGAEPAGAQLSEPAAAPTPAMPAASASAVARETEPELASPDSLEQDTPEAVEALLHLASQVDGLPFEGGESARSHAQPEADGNSEGSSLICMLPVQGGSGASTVALHVADAISRMREERVLLVDFDFHSGTLAFRLGLKPELTLADAIDSAEAKPELLERAVCRWNQLDVLVAPPSTSSIRPESLQRIPALFAAAMKVYHYVIVDHPDAIYSSSHPILTIASAVYLVCTPEITSLHLARRKAQHLRGVGVPAERLHLIVNRAGSWGSLDIKDISKVVGAPVEWSLSNDYQAVREAAWNGGLVQQQSALAQQLRQLGAHVMGEPEAALSQALVPATSKPFSD